MKITFLRASRVFPQRGSPLARIFRAPYGAGAKCGDDWLRWPTFHVFFQCMSCYFILEKRNPGSRGAHSHMGPRPVRPKNGGNPLGNPRFQGPPPGSQSATSRNLPPPLLGVFIDFSSIWSDMAASFAETGQLRPPIAISKIAGARDFLQNSQKSTFQKSTFFYKNRC